MESLLKILFAVFLALPAWASGTETVLGRLNKTFAPKSKLAGSYTQERFVKSLGVTLNSSGKFSMKKGGGITWEQIKPFASNLNISEKEISISVDDSPLRTLSPETDPVLHSFGRAFLTLLKGEESALQSQFNIKEEGSNKKWTMSLTPKEELISKAIKSIKISGDDFVKNVRIEDQNNNFMKIVFKDIQVSGSAKP